MRYSNKLKSRKGFTLIEVMVVVAVLAILAAIAYPSYLNYVTRAHRAVAKGVLLDVAGKQEQFYSSNKQYAANLSSLGYAADTVYVDKNNNITGSSTSDSIYTITMSATNTTFTANAAPQGSQSSDTGCGTLSLNHLGVKSVSGSYGVNKCW